MIDLYYLFVYLCNETFKSYILDLHYKFEVFENVT